MNEWLSLSSIARESVTAGTICKLYGVPVEWVASFPRFSPTTQKLSGDILLADGRDWLVFNIAITGKEFSEVSKELNGVKYWDQQVKGNLYWQTEEQHILLDNMANHRWVFIVKEGGTGIRYVIGSPRVGASLAFEYSDKQGTLTQMTASFRSIHRAPIYLGAVGTSVGALIDGGGYFIVDSTGAYISSADAGSSMVDFTAGDFAPIGDFSP